MSFILDEKPMFIMRVTQWLIRSYPFCPKCDVKMQRDNEAKHDKMLGYYECPTCGWRTKSRDRVE